MDIKGKNISISLRPPTPEVDPRVAQLVSKLQTPSQATDDRTAAEVRDEDLFAALEDDDDVEFAALREKRMEALQSEYVSSLHETVMLTS